MRVLRLALYLAAPILFMLIPTHYFESGRGICLFRNLFGFECPGCGMTRAFSALLHGDPVSAVGYNASVVIVFPLLAFVIAKGAAREIRGIWMQRKES